MLERDSVISLLWWQCEFIPYEIVIFLFNRLFKARPVFAALLRARQIRAQDLSGSPVCESVTQPACAGMAEVKLSVPCLLFLACWVNEHIIKTISPGF